MYEIDTLHRSTAKEIQEVLRWFRAMPKQLRGLAELGRHPDQPAAPRLFRTQGPSATPDDEEYPTQVDAEGAKLPGAFLKVTYDDSAGDPVSVDTITLERDIYSPWGWIPRLVDVEVVMISGLLVVNYVPILPVEFDGSGVTAPDTVEAEIVDYGDADTQTFDVHVLTQPGSSTAERGYAWLNPREKRWEIISGGGAGADVYFGKLDSSLSSGSTGTMSIWADGSDTTENMTVMNRTGKTLLSGILMKATRGVSCTEYLVEPYELAEC